MKRQKLNKENVSRYMIVVLIVIIVVLPGIKQAYNQDRAANIYLDKALLAAEWINSSAVKIPGGSKVWPAYPRALHTVDNTLLFCSFLKPIIPPVRNNTWMMPVKAPTIF